MAHLASYTWPGNVRQLRSVLEGALAMAEDRGVIHAGDLHLPRESPPITRRHLPRA